MSENIQITEAQSNFINEALFGFSNRRNAEITDETRFVHYTSADTAMKIIIGDNGRNAMWLRNATEMNDFSEVQFGQFCLREALSDGQFAERFKSAVNAINPSLLKELADMLDAETNHLKLNTYLLSLSMHSGSELDTGILSMWRAYGGRSGVCLVLNNEALGEQDAYDLAICPVSYEGPPGFKKELAGLIASLEKNCEGLKELPFEIVRDNIKRVIDYAVLTTKHPSFEEEKEWRIIYRPIGDGVLQSKVVSLDGIVQRVYLLPFENVEVPDGNSVTNASLPEILEKIIIGPTPNPELVRQAFVDLLSEATVPQAETRVIPSFIPLRQ